MSKVVGEVIAAGVVIVMGLIGFFALLLLGSVWFAYIGTILWGWFITPLFGMVAPPIMALAGLILAIRYIVINHNVTTNKQDNLGTAFVNTFSYPLMALLVGWIITLFL